MFLLQRKYWSFILKAYYAAVTLPVTNPSMKTKVTGSRHSFAFASAALSITEERNDVRIFKNNQPL